MNLHHETITSADVVMVGAYDYRIVALSVVIAILASYAAIDLAGRVTVTRGKARRGWLIGGAIVTGIGTWSMHYVGMLAFSLPVPVQYDWPTSLLSFVPSVFASAVALFVVSRREMGIFRTWMGSIFMGGGIAALHYVAMESMRLPGMCHYSLALVALSVLLAIVISLLSLRLTFHFRHGAAGQRSRKSASAVLMGAAICVMHYTGMASASFTHSDVAPDLAHAVSVSFLGIIGMGTVSVMVLVLAILTSLVDRLQEQRSLLDELFEQAPEAVALLSAEERVIRVNRHFSRMFGYSPEETLGHRLSDLIVPVELRDEDQKHADAVAHGDRVDAETVRHRKDGSRLHVSLVRVPVSVGGERIVIYGIYHDISERKAAEERLRESEARFRRLLASNIVGVVFWDLQGDITEANDLFLKMVGYTREDLRQGNVSWKNLTPPEYAPVDEKAIREMETTGTCAPFEKEYIHKDGRRVFVLIGSALDAQQQTGSSFIMDITERKEAAQKIEDFAELFQALSHHLLHVQEEERRHLARELHDEIGQALTAAKLNLKIIAPDVPPAAAGRLEDSIQLLDRLLDQVRQLSLDLRPPLLDELGLVPALRWLVDQQARRSGLRVTFTANVESVEMDRPGRTACFRIAQEAITNAIRHAQARTVTVDLRAEPDRVWLVVQDDGVGFDKDAMQQRAARGSSVGLLSMNERVALLGGELEVNSARGRGTEIRAWFPLAPAEPGATP